MRIINIGCSSIIVLLVLLCGLLMIYSYFKNPKPEIRNKVWLSMLKNKKIDRIRLVGSRSAELYNEIDTVDINDKVVLERASDYFLKNKLIIRDSAHYKSQLYMCNAILFSADSSYLLYLSKSTSGVGTIETSRSDSVYHNNMFINYLDSIFQAGIKNK